MGKKGINSAQVFFWLEWWEGEVTGFEILTEGLDVHMECVSNLVSLGRRLIDVQKLLIHFGISLPEFILRHAFAPKGTANSFYSLEQFDKSAVRICQATD